MGFCVSAALLIAGERVNIVTNIVYCVQLDAL